MIAVNEKTFECEGFLKAAKLDTPLGPMVAIGDDRALYLLEFDKKPALQHEIEQLQVQTKSTILPGETKATLSIKKELSDYFAGRLRTFLTPLHLFGSPFQKSVWAELQKIPYGKTCSYKEIAEAIGKQAAFRAVAQANGRNQLAIIIPCHRVINTNGKIGGYSGGISRKEWLLAHERKIV